MAISTAVIQEKPARRTRPTRTAATYADCLEWGEDIRAEIIEGEVFVMPSPVWDHQRIILQLLLQFGAFLEQNPLGKVCPGPIDVRLFPRADLMDTTVLVPDIVVVCDGAKLDGRSVNGAPDVVIEVLSPSTVKRDKVVKLKLYREAGVKDYWLVSPEKKTVTVCSLETGQEQVYGPEDTVEVAALPGCAIRLEPVFARM